MPAAPALQHSTASYVNLSRITAISRIPITSGLVYRVIRVVGDPIVTSPTPYPTPQPSVASGLTVTHVTVANLLGKARIIGRTKPFRLGVAVVASGTV